MNGPAENIRADVVADFGREWDAYDQTEMPDEEWAKLFDAYFGIFDFANLKEGFDLGCGSGRWAKMVAPRVGRLHCIDPAEKALAVARRRLAEEPNVEFHLASSAQIPLPDESQDFGYSLGVLHHIPDTEAAMRDCVRKLKPGAQFLVYLYYRFDNRPAWFRAIWKGSDVVRRAVSVLPFGLKKPVTTAIAAVVYYPLARSAKWLERAGMDVTNLPLTDYRNLSFYTLRTDALDRFGTKLEHRFNRAEITQMMMRCGLTGIRFSEKSPFWVACGVKA